MSSHDHRTWTGKLRRAKSAGVMAPTVTDSPSSSVENSTGILSSSPSTPPKKAWERHYRSFLKTKTGDEGDDQQQTDASEGVLPTRTTSSATFRLLPGSRRLLIKPPLGDPLPDTDGPCIPDLSARAHSDVAVRGGSFFQSVFHKQPHHRKIKSSEGLAPQHRRIFTKSFDDLDSTLRRGQDKTLSPRSSPKNVSFLSTNDDTMPPPPPSNMPSAFLATQRPTTRSQLALASIETPLSAKKAQSTEIKKAFTEYHNSTKFAQDSTSAYLGDEPSAHKNSYFAQFNPMIAANVMSVSERMPSSGKGGLSRSVPMDTVTEDMAMYRSTTMLKVLEGPESWHSGRRYLIAPAALTSCPLSVLSALSGSAELYSGMDESPFGSIDLGRATLSYIGRPQQHLPHGWSTCDLVLRQNYLLEYEVGVRGIPRGVVHLEHARAYSGEFATSLELEFYGSPCAKSDKRVLLMRVDSKAERERWVTCLNDASRLSVQDLYTYDKDRPFGRGRYAAVYPARRLDDRGNTGHGPNCAIKVIDKNEFWKRVVKGMERADTLVRETSVQATLTAKCGRIPSFLQIRSFFETIDNIVIELELLEGTDLFHYISTKGSLPENEAANIMKDILTSLDSMSRIGLAHRDIKPANILMADREKNGVNVKVGDFGMSAFVGVDGLVRGRCGTPGYVAPEIFTAGIHGGYGNKVDVFSAGVTLYVMLCGYEPFYGESDVELIAANKEAEVDFPESDWQHLTREARDLVEQMLRRDPDQRISAKEALQHPWIIRNVTVSYDDLDTSSSSCNFDISRGTACTIS